ncbi:hypothetical protein P170DRAFT_350779 [Aspergillus steynii IBT 23096]|uniref:P-loop containing nucleoside triphosphate hydrolase protein n=1 Tax=Aspergillus steynii IBT 23096 TaxID=1392250 RepID=A0A2I2GKD3_9EURO|nr:uncharacterized protein P170DRAFT_350779 [Aspergillus steynii IBT 23096]PLB53342.1 hypothetical protein P170DRAFT_350779 [Aspergillus steynii IBT 23096]
MRAEHPPQRLFLVTYPRTASNLLLKILALDEQPDTLTNKSGGYYFRPAFLKTGMTGKPHRPTGHLSRDEAHDLQRVFQACFEKLEHDSNAAIDQGKQYFVKEHALWLSNPTNISAALGEQNAHPESSFRVQQNFSSTSTWSPKNQTVLPDEALRKWCLVFLIRHPALAFPSYYRAVLDLRDEGYLHESEVQPHLQANMTLQWTRSLYDWSCEQGSAPLVLDADDVISDYAVVVRLCEMTGLRASRLRLTWNSVSEEDEGECSLEIDTKRSLGAIMEKTLSGSTGVVEGKCSVGIDIAIESEKWKRDFGQEVGESLERSVRTAMPDYEYLRARRIVSKTI